MKIKIRKDAARIFGMTEHTNPGWMQKLMKIQGTVLDVEIDCLFSDQFNTGPIEGVTEIGLRIMSNLVEEVIDDVRDGIIKCSWCGTSQDVNHCCKKCNKTDHLSGLTTKSQVSLDYAMRAKAERDAGGSCVVNSSLPTIAIKMSDESEYFFQGEDAENLIEEYESFDWLVVEIEEYLLAIAQSW